MNKGESPGAGSSGDERCERFGMREIDSVSCSRVGRFEDELFEGRGDERRELFEGGEIDGVICSRVGRLTA